MNKPPNLRYLNSCANCCNSTQKSSGYICHKYTLVVSEEVICDDYEGAKAIIERFLKVVK